MIVTEEVKQCIDKCPDFIDFPTAWAIQNTMNEHLEHDPKCSSVEGWHPLSGPAFLCDCGAVIRTWGKITGKIHK